MVINILNIIPGPYGFNKILANHTHGCIIERETHTQIMYLDQVGLP